MLPILVFVVTLFTIASTCSLTQDQYQFLFTRYIIAHSKQYETQHFLSRYTNFRTTLNEIIRHNAETFDVVETLNGSMKTTKIPKHSWRMGLNQFSDMSDVEFHQSLNLLPISKSSTKSTQTPHLPTPTPSSLKFPSHDIDWESKGVLTPIKNQHSCGGCYAFAAVGTVESQHKIVNNELLVLSEQQAIDCSPAYHSHGCNGGNMQNVFNYYMKSGDGGVCLDSDYPFISKQGDTCQKCRPVTQIEGFIVAKGGTDNLFAVLDNGPVAVAIAAAGIKNYESGVFTRCSDKQLNHAIILTGYVREHPTTKLPAWRLKNSWGSWGDQGMMWIDGSHGDCLGMEKTAALDEFNVQPQVIKK